MGTTHPMYRALTHLYPRSFRGEYGDDLVQHFGDLVSDRGQRAAWTRTGVDLIVTIPYYRLESIMTEHQSATTLGIAIGLLTAGGIASLLTGVGPWLLLLAAAGVLAFAQRGALARAIRTPDSNLRRRRLMTAAVLGVVFVGLYVAYISLIGDRWTVRETVFTIIGTSAMFGAAGFLIAGLLTPKSPSPSPSASTPATR